MATPRRETSSHRLTYPDCDTPTGSYRRPFFRPRNADLPCIVSFPWVFVMAGHGAVRPRQQGIRLSGSARSAQGGMAQLYEFIVSRRATDTAAPSSLSS